MARPEKVAVVDEVREDLTGSTAVLFTEYRGLTVSELAELRGQLREAGARYKIVKNTLARLAARDAGFGDLEEVLTGPTALTFAGDDPVSPAKVLRKFAKDHPELVVKGAILEGRMVDAGTADRLADLETRDELLARLAGLMDGALANFARLLQAPIAHMTRLVAALEAEGGAPGAPSDTEAPAAEAAEAPGEADEAQEPVPADEGGRAEAASQPTDSESTGTEPDDEAASETDDEAASETDDQAASETDDQALSETDDQALSETDDQAASETDDDTETTE